MSEEEDSYCRLCAEPTPKSQLIAPDEDVGLNSKIAKKMLWININVSASNILPNSICFSCFDALERTWVFLNDVRTAQIKLNEIFLKKNEPEETSTDDKIELEISAKPVNVDWEDFEVLKQEIKPEILNDEFTITTVDPNTILELAVVKDERVSNEDDGDFHVDSDGLNNTDSDSSVYRPYQKKKDKKKKKYHSDDSDGLNGFDDIEKITWDDYMCRCAHCDAQCENIMSLRLHSLQIHARCCTFKCSECGKVVTSSKSFINHVRRFHKKVLRFCCEYCNKYFNNTFYLKSHYNQIHYDTTSLSCPTCGSMFESPDLLQDHLVIYSKKVRKRALKQEKLDSDDLKCEHCHKEFKSRSNLIQHKLVHTERSREFSCHVCGKMFFTRGTLINHMMTHEDAKPFKCEFCPMTFRARGNLQSHISLHSGAKPFVCEQCGKSFRVKRHLKSHSIIHTDLMPYVCPYCNKNFRFKTRLNQHLRQHTGAKPYKCIYCQRDFTNGSNYKKHMKRKHNIDTSRKKYNNVVEQSAETIETSDVERNQT